MATIRLDADRTHVAGRIVLSKADFDRVLHHPPEYFAEAVRAIRLFIPLSHH
jgi:hypothetical protein